jgi:hypothetical protein
VLLVANNTDEVEAVVTRTSPTPSAKERSHQSPSFFAQNG